MAKRVKHGKAYNIDQGMVRIVGNNPNITDGVSIGANTSDNLQVDNGEVLIGAEASKSGKTLYPTSDNIKVLSAQPMLGGVSPVQLLYGGMPPDTVFAMQEGYKDIHGINDDGSRQNAQFGIRKKFQEGGEDKNEEPKKRSVIAYGDKTSTRLRYLNLDKKLVAYINHIAKQYNISPVVLASRLSSEGAVDKHIQYLDGNRDKKGESLLEHIYSSGYIHYGLDDTFSLYKKGKLNLRRKIPFQKDININEHNRTVHSVQVRDPYDGIELMAANIEYLGKEIKKKFPNLKDKDLDTAIIKAYNMGLYGAINDISKNGVGTKYKINNGYYNINYNNDIYLQNKDKTYNINKFTINEQNAEIDKWADVYNSNVDDARKYNNAQIYPTKDFQKEWAKKHAIKSLTEGDYQFAYPIGTDYTYNNPFANVDFSFKFGGQTNINSLGERPNAKYEIEMSNPVKKANKYYERKLKEENPKMSFPEKLQKIHNEYKELMSPHSIEDIEKMFKRIYKGEPKRGLKKRLERGLYNKYKLENINPQIDSSYLFNQYTINNNNNSENKRNKAALGRQQFSISGLPAFDFTVPNTFGNYSLNKPFYPTYVDGPLIGLRVPQKTLNVPAFPTNFSPKSTVGQIDPFIGTKPAFETSTTGTQKTNSVEGLTKGNGPSTNEMSLYGAIGNTVGALIGAGIQQNAINNLEAPKRQYTLLNPIKLKTKININPQIARMREMQAQLADAARRTSGSSRTAYQKMLAGHNRLLDSAMDLYGRKENAETELINRDRLNQQQVAHTNATNVMNTVNYNNEVATEMRNRKRVATSNNWTTALNTTTGAWAGPNGFIDRANALRVKAGELYTQAIANPTAARLLYGDIDFTTGANKRKAFNTIYDFLNNNRFA